MEESFTKKNFVCVKKGHDLQSLTLINLDPEYKNPQKIGCVYCLYEDWDKYKTKVCLIKDIENAKSPWTIKNWPAQEEIYKIGQLMRPNQKEEVIMVDGLFDDFKDKINYEIEKTREWVHSNSNKIDRLKANKIKVRLEESFTLEPLIKILVDFTKKNNSNLGNPDDKVTHLDSLNNQVNQFVSEDRIKKAQEIKNIFRNELIYAGKMKYDETYIRQAIHNIKIQLHQARQQFFVEKLELSFFPSSFKESKKNVKIDGNKISFYGAYGSGTIVYSNPFTRYKNMSIKFKLTENDGMHESFYFGVTSEIAKNEMFWQSKGNQIDLQKIKPNFKHPFKVINGTKWPGEIIANGIIFVAEICVDQNQIKIFDRDMESIVENTFIMEGDMDWRIVFGIFSNHRIDLEILDCWGYI